MDNHPIPQDVTGFQFKLIGNLTVKQFAYLATGIVFGWVLLQLPVNILIKFPLGALSAILGIGLAYFPVGGRPMDLMIGNYIKALFRPTQFIYKKTGGQIYFPNNVPFSAARSVSQYKNDLNIFPKDKLKAYLESMNTESQRVVDERENTFLTSVASLTTGNVSHLPAATPSLTTQQTSPQPILIIRNSSPLPPSEFTSAKAVPAETQTPAAVAPQPVTTPHPAPRAQLSEKQEALQQPVSFGQIKTAKPIRTMNTQIPPDFPNLITGSARDARGNPLSNILVEIKDKDGNPVRAFKTNEVGRFASATPLLNGTYTIEFEDPKAQNRFEKITLNVTGQIIAPVEAISIDTREELRRSLFNAN